MGELRPDAALFPMVNQAGCREKLFVTQLPVFVTYFHAGVCFDPLRYQFDISTNLQRGNNHTDSRDSLETVGDGPIWTA